LLKSDDETKDNMRILLAHIGYLQQTLGDYTEAISYYEESLQIMDNNDPRRYMPIMDIAWSKFYLSQGRDTTVLQQVYEETKPMLRRVEYLLNQYEKGYAYYAASKIAFQLGRFDEAVQLLKTELNLIENNLTADNATDARLGLAITLLYLKKNVEANDVFRKIHWVTVSKDSLALWYWLKGDTVLARRYLEKYFVEECPNEIARENLRRIIRSNEILPYDMWRDARKKKWFRKLIYTNTLDSTTEQHTEKPENETQDEIETYTNENQDKGIGIRNIKKETEEY
jgi:tetratricopeptide (TPR) repeat protein